jgi:hypothetical protein
MAGDPYDDVAPDVQPEMAPPGVPGAVVVQQAPVADPSRAEAFINKHAGRSQQYMVNFDDLMRQRQDAIKAASDQLSGTISKLQERHSGANGGINLPMLMMGAAMLGTHGTFGDKLGAGLLNMGKTVAQQRMNDTEFYRGIAELQQKQAQINDMPLKDAATFARTGALNEDKNVSALERALITSKADRPQSLGGGMIYDPKKDVVINGYTGQVIGGGMMSGKPGENDNFGSKLIGSDVHGEDFLKSIQDPVMRSYIKSLGDYSAPPPTSAGRSPATAAYQHMLFTLASQYNPDFNAQDYATIQKGRKDWTGSGKMAMQINSGVTATGHLANLQEGAARLDNGDFAKFNNIGNWIKQNSGSPQVKQFLADLNIVSNELSKFLGGGKPAEQEIGEWRQAINAADSPAALQGVIQEMARAMHTQLQTLSDAKTRDLGGKHKFTPQEMLGQEHEKVMEDIFANDISKPGGRLAVLRRSQNQERVLGGQQPLPTPTAKQWAAGVDMLKKNPTPEARAQFDAAFGEGSAAMVLGK